MKIFLTTTFKREAKRLHRNQKVALEDAIKDISKNPAIGELKVGDLAGIRVHKFHMVNQLILLSYLYDEVETIKLLSFAPHENFYDNLKKQLKNSDLDEIRIIP